MILQTDSTHAPRTVRRNRYRSPALMLLVLLMPSLQVSAQTDTRTAVNLPSDDRAHLLEEMRNFLTYTTATLGAITEHDMAQVQQLAEQVRPPLAQARKLASATPVSPAMDTDQTQERRGRGDPARFERMRRNLPQPFRLMMQQMREGIAELGRDAVVRNDTMHTLRQLHQVQQVCVTCHEAYRLQDGG